MWLDLNDVETSPFTGSYDVCVCGSGPAGISAARKIAERGGRVLLLEAGGLEPTQESTDVYRGKSVGRTYWGVDHARLRYFGGTSGHWAGLCGLFDPLDFEERDIWELPGWPISRDEAYTHLAEACDIVDLPHANFPDQPAPAPLDGTFRRYPRQLSAPTRFGTKFREEIKNHQRIDTAINANVVGLDLTEGGDAVSGLRVENYRGASFNITARKFIIAFGALENARFLLTADRTNNGALSAKSPMIGKCFMEHFGIALGRFIVTRPDFWAQHQKLEIKPKVEFLKENRLGNSTLALNSTAQLRFYGRLAPVKKIGRTITCSAPPLTRFARRFDSFPCPGDGAVTTMMEQTPNPASQIRLDDTETDQFGNPRLALDWQISEVDKKTIKELTLDLGKAIARENLGRMQVYDGVTTAETELGLHSHHMGTTRMSASSAHGVVDRNCKFHGIDNLYIAGASVFPTGGGNNPTLTLVSLALRLGDHLASEIAD